MFTAQQLRELPPEQVKEALGQLSKKQVEELHHDWNFWARPNQKEPQEDWWRVWLLNQGRGAGKTRSGAEWCRGQVKKGKKRGAAVAATNSDIERVMVKGESGFLNICPKVDKIKGGRFVGYPEWSPTKRTLTWYESDSKGNFKTNSNGKFIKVSSIEFYSAEEPERLRGPQFEFGWADELAAWNKSEDTWDMLQFCLRLGRKPRVVVTTTPKPTKLVRKLLAGTKDQYDSEGNITKHKYVYLTTGSTFDNAANLADTFLESVKTQYEGTRLGRQELYAEILEEAEGALWTTDMLDNAQVAKADVPQLNRVVVSVDPAITSNAESDMTGIVVAGVDINGKAYVLGDYTDRLSPQGWASKAIELYHEFEADRIVAERNQGGDMVRNTIQVEDETVPIKLVHASRGKFARAEPVSALYERNLVYHVRDCEASLGELETQQRTWEPLGSIGSPDRLDALVWAITDLLLNSYQKPQLQLVYSNSKGLR